jgi:hypothetical protein
MLILKTGRDSLEIGANSQRKELYKVLNIFNQIANLASGTLAVAAAVSSAAPQVSAENHKQATLDLTGVALQAAAKVACASTGNIWVILASNLLPAMYDEVMTVVNKHGLIASAMTQATVAPAVQAPAQAPVH